MENFTNKIYARLNKNNIVIKLFSSVFEQPIEGDILVEEGNEEYHAHVHLKYELMDMNGNYNYKFVDDKMVGLTEKEKEKLFPKEIIEPVENQINALKNQLEQLQQDLADMLLNMI